MPTLGNYTCGNNGQIGTFQKSREIAAMSLGYHLTAFLALWLVEASSPYIPKALPRQRKATMANERD